MALKLKFRTIFPALVSAASPLTLVKTGLAYAFGFDIAALRASLDPLYQPINTTREKLTANRTYYVLTTGSDSNTGLANTAVGAFLTLQKAYDVVNKTLDIVSFTVTIQVGAGTYAPVICDGSPPGYGAITFVGDTTTPTNVVISSSTSVAAFSAQNKAQVNIGGFSFNSTSGNGIEAVDGASITVNANSDFGACPGASAAQIYASRMGKIRIPFNFTIHGNSGYFAQASHGGQIRLDTGIGTWTASTTYSASVVLVDSGEFITSSGFTFAVGAFTVTGAQWKSIENGVVQCNGISPPTDGFIPGTVVGTGIYGGATNQPGFWLQRSTALFLVGAAANGTIFQKSDGITNLGSIDDSGNFSTIGRVLSSGAGGVGYATGAGGAVTQATSKATAVTLNKSTGLITLNNAALAATTIVSFVLTDSAIAATDQIMVSHESGGTLGGYTVNGRATGAGAGAIDVRNNTAGSLAEAIVLRFSIIKSVNA